MHIEELKEGEERKLHVGDGVSVSDAKRVLVGAGARALFYPTLLYNVVRNKIQAEFRWWDKVDEFILLGAVPFPIDVPRLKELGVRGVITLNESYETLVPTTLYHVHILRYGTLSGSTPLNRVKRLILHAAHGIDHLVIPTRDYCFAPSLRDICSAVDFIHQNALSGQTTYVHCKAGRGRSTTIVICYLVRHKLMTPESAYDYVKSIRPRVLLASAQWAAVQEYFHLVVRSAATYAPMASLIVKGSHSAAASQGLVKFDDSSVVVVTESDLQGYDPSIESGNGTSEIWADLSVVYRVRVAGKAALTRISCLWLQYRTNQKISAEKLSRESNCLIRTNHLGGISLDIHVY